LASSTDARENGEEKDSVGGNSGENLWGGGRLETEGEKTGEEAGNTARLPSSTKASEKKAST